MGAGGEGDSRELRLVDGIWAQVSDRDEEPPGSRGRDVASAQGAGQLVLTAGGRRGDSHGAGGT